jgi:hypothetical protein
MRAFRSFLIMLIHTGPYLAQVRLQDLDDPPLALRERLEGERPAEHVLGRAQV